MGMVLFQLLIATVCGGVIGYQRETLDRPAGFRTHVLVCVGSAVYMLVSVAVAGAQYDPGRIAAQVASGIGFLGAGTIIKQGSIVRGLTTAASLWAVAGIGLAAGYGGPALEIALLGTLVVFVSLSTLKRIESRISKGRECTVKLLVEKGANTVDWVREVLAAHGVDIREIDIRENEQGWFQFHITGRVLANDDIEAAISELSQGPGVHGFSWQCR